MEFNKRLLLAQITPAAVLGILYAIFSGNIIVAVIFAFFVFVISVAASAMTGQANIRTAKGKYSFISDETIFDNSILVLLTAVMKADGKRSEKEMKYIELALSEHFEKPRVANMLKLIDRLYAAESLNYYKVCNVVEMNFRLNERIQLMHFLVGIVTADGVLTKKEKETLLDIARNIDLTSTMVGSILNMFNYITEEELNYRKQRNEQKAYNYSMDMVRALKILGLSQEANEKQIKKAYRKLAMQHHPDRLIHLGEVHQKLAKEKFQLISDAYEFVKLKKGFA